MDAKLRKISEDMQEMLTKLSNGIKKLNEIFFTIIII